MRRLMRTCLCLGLIAGSVTAGLAADPPVFTHMRYKLEELDNDVAYRIREGLIKKIDIDAQLSLTVEPIKKLDSDKAWAYYPKSANKTLTSNLEIAVKAMVEKPNGKVSHLHISGYDKIQGKELGLVWHELNDLRVIYINVNPTRWKRDDTIALSLLVRDSKTKDELEEITYYVKAELIGLTRRFSTGLVFSQLTKEMTKEMTDDTTDGMTDDTTGTEINRPWKSNMMAQVNWFYDIREPKKGVERFWNWAGIGAGLHLASLSHSDSTGSTGSGVQFGIGANIAFWDGLVSVGIGRNLSIEREYHFITIDLFDILDGKVGD